MAVLISIKPKWCEMIVSGEKTIEVRKTRPKCETPFKCYIYCTNDRKIMLERSNYDKSIYLNGNIYYPYKNDCSLNGKVIGEFLCDKFTDKYFPLIEGSCLSVEELHEYANGGNIYGWHISDLKIYDKPKELSEFFHYCGDSHNCDGCEYYYTESNESIDFYAECCSPFDGCKPLKRPPQSWMYVMYVEELA